MRRKREGERRSEEKESTFSSFERGREREARVRNTGAQGQAMDSAHYLQRLDVSTSHTHTHTHTYCPLPWAHIHIPGRTHTLTHTLANTPCVVE